MLISSHPFRSLGIINADGTAADLDKLKKLRLSFSADQHWQDLVTDSMASCQDAAPAQLTARQLAVHSFLCFKWSLFADCDGQQEKLDMLDAEGALRRARALSGACPESPSRIQNSLEKIAGRTWEECSRGLYTGDDAKKMYAAEVSRVACLLQDFNDIDGNIDFSRMVEAIQEQNEKGDSQSITLLRMVEKCTACEPLSPDFDAACYPDMTAEKFAKCWASRGVLSCTYQQANQVASGSSDTCVISVV